jgi:hypothetical protein
MENQEKETKESLKTNLPYGSNAEIKRRVYKNFGRTVSASTIGNILDPNKEAWDNDVILTALDLVAENTSKREQIAEKLSKMQTA